MRGGRGNLMYIEATPSPSAEGKREEGATGGGGGGTPAGPQDLPLRRQLFPANNEGM